MSNKFNLSDEQIKRTVELLILTAHNKKQKAIFAAGGVAMPVCKTFAELEELKNIIEKSFPSCNKKFSDFKPGDKIVFNLPARYRDKINE